jgi:hypothetical protein
VIGRSHSQENSFRTYKLLSHARFFCACIPRHARHIESNEFIRHMKERRTAMCLTDSTTNLFFAQLSCIHEGVFPLILSIIYTQGWLDGRIRLLLVFFSLLGIHFWTVFLSSDHLNGTCSVLVCEFLLFLLRCLLDSPGFPCSFCVLDSR